MAFKYLRDELSCSICLSVYTDPVTLRCGHNFCRVCIDRVLDTQEGAGVYTCPECRDKVQERPVLKRNITLRNIAERFLSRMPEQKEPGVFCSHCIHSPVPAVKSCLHCEASLCDDHLRVHSKSPEHVLSDPTTALENRKCSVHKKILEYYCSEDGAYVCVSCSLDGEHVGHQMEPLSVVYKKFKEKLRYVLDKLNSRTEETEKRIQSLKKHRREVREKSANLKKRALVIFKDIRKQLKALEKRILAEVYKYEAKALHPLSDLIQQLEVKKDELSKKMCDIEELCNMTDPVIFLQGWESNCAEVCDTEEGGNEDRERDDRQVHDVGGLDEGLISETLYTGFSDIVTAVKKSIYVSGTSDILLDISTAGNDVAVSNDLKTVFRSVISQNRPETPERFQCFQVISSTSFSSGRHYWEVETSESGFWMVGMCYPSIDRKENQPCIGNNNKSWCLCSYNTQYSVRHNSIIELLHQVTSSGRLRICLDYEAGRLSFYELCDPIRHLHTFTATFTEPLHAAFWVWDGWVRIREKIHLLLNYVHNYP